MSPRLRLRVLALVAISAGALGVALPSTVGAARGFSFGVAAGDVSAKSAILWARANREGAVLLQVVRGNRFPPCRVGAGLGSIGAGIGIAVRARASDSNDNTVQRRVGGLRPGTEYHYRFCMRGGARSATGTFETSPGPGQARTIRFAMTGDQDALPRPGESRPFWNRFQIWNLIRRERNDFNVLLGDTIYSDTEVAGYGLANVATTVPQKWAKYRLNLGQAPWVRARGSAAYYAHWDDHEFINNFSPLANEFPLDVGTVRINGRAIYQRGLNAFRDYNPITYSARNGIYRSFRWGRNLEIFMLDERSFRSRLADYQGNCDNPPGSGNRDLAPTAPQSIRTAFSFFVPHLANPVPPQCTAAINDPDRTFLGARQLARFKRAIRRSTATFKVIFSEMPIQQFYLDPYDRWEGYAAERTNLLRFLVDNIDNVVFLSSDVHANLVNDVRFQTLEEGGPVDSGITEITTGPVATRSFARQVIATTGNESGAIVAHDAFLKPPPPNGLGMRCASIDQFSYAQVTVTRNQLRVQLKDIKGDRVQDTGDRDTPGPPCGPYVFPRE
jgi:phosphodiesterase/alkaline phosphatase D-like protein